MSDTNTTHHVLLCDDESSPFSYDQNFAALDQWLQANAPDVKLTDTQTMLELGIVTIIAGDVDAMLLNTCPVVDSVNANRL